MLSARLREQLRDPDYRQLHFAAASAIKGIKASAWYDAQFLQLFETAQRYLAMVRPETVGDFVARFEPLRTPRDFQIRHLPDLFDAAEVARIRQEVAELRAEQIELHEIENFGRTVVHAHPYFTRLQQDLVPMVSEIVGQQVEPGYNFLSQYGNSGRCDPHMDTPVCMYTLDYCIDQSAEWPIYFSDVVDWPTADDLNTLTPAAIMEDPSIRFYEHVLQPNNAILFAGSSQWHYRKAMPQPGFCNLLFLHYYPSAMKSLLHLRDWPEALGIPELQAFCDIYFEAYPVLETRNLG